MANTAFQTMYRDEYIAGYERSISKLGVAVTREAQTKGNQATFLIADTGGAEAVTRGANGLIPANQDNLTQLTAVLKEWHDLRQRTSFNIFASQGDGRKILQDMSRKVMARRIDNDIITELSNATQTLGAAATFSLSIATMAMGVLGANDVATDEEDNMFFVHTPAVEHYLMQIPQFTSSDYVTIKAFDGGNRTYRRWAGFNWIKHTGLPGMGTSSETCFAFHRGAIGQVVNTTDLSTVVGYNEEQDYSFARTSAFMGSKILQNKGILKVLHNGAAVVAS